MDNTTGAIFVRGFYFFIHREVNSAILTLYLYFTLNIYRPGYLTDIQLLMLERIFVHIGWYGHNWTETQPVIRLSLFLCGLLTSLSSLSFPFLSPSVSLLDNGMKTEMQIEGTTYLTQTDTFGKPILCCTTTWVFPFIFIF